MKLGVNIDHIATLRQARREFEPSPVAAARICEKAGADSIVCHLREDRRHINDEDVRRLKKTVKTRLNLEMSLNPEIVRMAGRIRPDQATIVPERRQEITTEGGLDVVKYFPKIKRAVAYLQKRGVEVSLFIAPNKTQVLKSKEAGATIIELHTGHYANARTAAARWRELKKIKEAAQLGERRGLFVSAGHGLKYDNTKEIARIREIKEFNIGHSIISRSIFVGLTQAVREMKWLIRK